MVQQNVQSCKLGAATWLLAALCGSALLGACSSSSFSSSGASKKSEKPKEQVEPATATKTDTDTDPAPTTKPDPACDEAAGATAVKLLTPTVANGDPSNHIDYEITVADCDGKPRQLVADYILFDVEALVTAGDQGTGYHYVVKAGTKSAEGSLERIVGSDLFGNSGAQYFHNRTDQVPTIAAGAASIQFRIEFAGGTFGPANSQGKPDNLLATYLRFGKAKVARQDVHFLGLP